MEASRSRITFVDGYASSAPYDRSSNVSPPKESAVDFPTLPSRAPPPTTTMSAEDQLSLNSCVDELVNILGTSVSRNAMIEALLKNNLNFEMALNEILESGLAASCDPSTPLDVVFPPASSSSSPGFESPPSPPLRPDPRSSPEFWSDESGGGGGGASGRNCRPIFIGDLEGRGIAYRQENPADCLGFGDVLSSRLTEAAAAAAAESNGKRDAVESTLENYCASRISSPEGCCDYRDLVENLRDLDEEEERSALALYGDYDNNNDANAEILSNMFVDELAKIRIKGRQRFSKKKGGCESLRLLEGVPDDDQWLSYGRLSTQMRRDAVKAKLIVKKNVTGFEDDFQRKRASCSSSPDFAASDDDPKLKGGSEAERNVEARKDRRQLQPRSGFLSTENLPPLDRPVTPTPPQQFQRRTSQQAQRSRPHRQVPPPPHQQQPRPCSDAAEFLASVWAESSRTMRQNRAQIKKLPQLKKARCKEASSMEKRRDSPLWTYSRLSRSLEEGEKSVDAREAPTETFPTSSAEAEAANVGGDVGRGGSVVSKCADGSRKERARTETLVVSGGGGGGGGGGGAARVKAAGDRDGGGAADENPESGLFFFPDDVKDEAWSASADGEDATQPRLKSSLPFKTTDRSTESLSSVISSSTSSSGNPHNLPSVSSSSSSSPLPPPTSCLESTHASNVTTHPPSTSSSLLPQSSSSSSPTSTTTAAPSNDDLDFLDDDFASVSSSLRNASTSTSDDGRLRPESSPLRVAAAAAVSSNYRQYFAQGARPKSAGNSGGRQQSLTSLSTTTTTTTTTPSSTSGETKLAEIQKPSSSPPPPSLDDAGNAALSNAKSLPIAGRSSPSSVLPPAVSNGGGGGPVSDSSSTDHSAREVERKANEEKSLAAAASSSTTASTTHASKSPSPSPLSRLGKGISLQQLAKEHAQSRATRSQSPLATTTPASKTPREDSESDGGGGGCLAADSSKLASSSSEIGKPYGRGGGFSSGSPSRICSWESTPTLVNSSSVKTPPSSSSSKPSLSALSSLARAHTSVTSDGSLLRSLETLDLSNMSADVFHSRHLGHVLGLPGFANIRLDDVADEDRKFARSVSVLDVGVWGGATTIDVGEAGLTNEDEASTIADTSKRFRYRRQRRSGVTKSKSSSGRATTSKSSGGASSTTGAASSTTATTGFLFDTPSPDDVVAEKQRMAFEHSSETKLSPATPSAASSGLNAAEDAAAAATKKHPEDEKVGVAREKREKRSKNAARKLSSRESREGTPSSGAGGQSEEPDDWESLF